MMFYVLLLSLGILGHALPLLLQYSTEADISSAGSILLSVKSEQHHFAHRLCCLSLLSAENPSAIF